MATTDSSYDGMPHLRNNLSNLSTLSSISNLSEISVDPGNIFQETVTAAANEDTDESDDDLDNTLFYDVQDYTEVRRISKIRDFSKRYICLCIF